MRLYIDADSCDETLIKLLRRAGHDVVSALETRTMHAHDADHLRWALEGNRVLVSRNHKDFEPLHKLILSAGGEHPGILVTRYDNDRARDMDERQIVSAI